MATDIQHQDSQAWCFRGSPALSAAPPPPWHAGGSLLWWEVCALECAWLLVEFGHTVSHVRGDSKDPSPPHSVESRGSMADGFAGQHPDGGPAPSLPILLVSSDCAPGSRRCPTSCDRPPTQPRPLGCRLLLALAP